MTTITTTIEDSDSLPMTNTTTEEGYVSLMKYGVCPRCINNTPLPS